MLSWEARSIVSGLLCKDPMKRLKGQDILRKWEFPPHWMHVTLMLWLLPACVRVSLVKQQAPCVILQGSMHTQFTLLTSLARP